MNENSNGRVSPDLLSKLVKWTGSRKGQQALIIITFSIFPVLLLIVFTGLPFIKMVEFSFFKMKYIGPREYIGLDNYKNVFSRTDIWQALFVSVYYLAGSVIQMALALYFAVILSFKVKCGNFFKGAMFFPYLINGIAIGFIFKFFYTRGFVLDTILSWVGFDLNRLPYWLKDTKINNISLVATSVWRYAGQNMVMFIGAIQSVSSELYEAAELDGANKWQQFKYIILPSIKSIVILNLILSVKGSLSAFEQPLVITGGGNGTDTYFLLMNNIAHNLQKVGLASAMAIVLLAIIIFVTILQDVFFKKVFKD